MKPNKVEDFINKTFNKIKVISYSHQIKVGRNKRNYYNVKCLNCNSETKMRDDKFTDKLPNNNCSICVKYCKGFGSSRKGSTEAVYKNIYTRYKYSAKIRNYEFNLEYDKFKDIISKNCFYCGSKPIETLKSKTINKTDIPVKHNGIDRVNNQLGYSEFNSLPCCSICNIMKRNLSFDDFIEHVSKIKNNIDKITE